MVSGSLKQADFPMHPGTRHVLAVTAMAAALLCLSACSGQGDRPAPSTSTGSGGSNSGNGGSNGGSSFTPGVFQPYAGFASQCAVPRTGIDPNTQQAYPDVQGSTTSENNWLRSWTNDTYLWYSEVVDANPASFTTPAYFELMKTTATTASGRPKDQFHFSIPTAEWEDLSQSGVSAGYGAQWFIISEVPPREIRVAYVEPGSPAAAAGVLRGDTVLTVDGADAVNGAAVDTLNAGLFPENVNETHQFTLRDVAGASRDVTLQSATITSVPVQNVAALTTSSGPVGYMLFNDHIATAENALINAITSLQTAGVTDLVLDIRYNGGGFLDIASELAFMIAGPTPTTGQTFERLSFNDKHTTTDPVTGEALTPVPFHSTTQNFSAGAGNPLPTLNLQRVFVLTGSGTCSASESIINSLRGVNVEVIQIGGTTCGKPYGFYPTPNCGTTYFSIQFKGVNAQNFGEYADGFSPQNTVFTPGEKLPGCSVQDDFAHALGDVGEARLAAALAYRATPGTCPSPPTGPVAKAKTQFSAAPVEGDMHKSPMRENRILRER